MLDFDAAFVPRHMGNAGTYSARAAVRAVPGLPVAAIFADEAHEFESSV